MSPQQHIPHGHWCGSWRAGSCQLNCKSLIVILYSRGGQGTFHREGWPSNVRLLFTFCSMLFVVSICCLCFVVYLSIFVICEIVIWSSSRSFTCHREGWQRCVRFLFVLLLFVICEIVIWYSSGRFTCHQEGWQSNVPPWFLHHCYAPPVGQNGK